MRTEMTTATERFLTARQVAEFTGLTVATVYRLQREGVLRSVRIGNRTVRFPLSSLQALAGPQEGAKA